MITVLLADDHTIVRQGLRMVIEAAQDMSVVGEVDDGLKVADACEALHPAILLLDLGLPGLHGLEVIRQVVKRVPRTRVLVLSMHAHDEYVLGALANGASGYLLKGSDSAELLNAIRQVAAGRRHISAELSTHLADALSQPGETVTTVDPYETLTAREREVLHLMAHGLGNAEIADRLFVSPRTVETHRANVLRKLRLRNQTEVVLFAVRRGFLVAE